MSFLRIFLYTWRHLIMTSFPNICIIILTLITIVHYPERSSCTYHSYFFMPYFCFFINTFKYFQWIIWMHFKNKWLILIKFLSLLWSPIYSCIKSKYTAKFWLNKWNSRAFIIAQLMEYNWLVSISWSSIN